MSAIRYEPAIDGLRAIAVTAVLVYHLAPHVLPGGFTGVDIFFVISGFLITRIITSEVDAGAFSLLRFYQRRIARIIPPLIVMASLTLLVACRSYSSEERASAATNFAATLLSTANIKLMLQGNYFEMSPDAQPFLHCWSLSVEEQFYLLFPALVAVLYRTSRRTALIAGVVAFIASFALCVWLTAVRQQWAFYLLPTRAWELLAGALVSRFRLATWGSTWHHPIGAGSVALLCWAIFGTPIDALFPGPLAVVPTLGAVGLLLATTNGAESSLARACSRPWLRSIGAISYSLYLWHWPIFSFVDYGVLFAPAATRTAIKTIACVAAACVSYACVEKPARAWLGKKRNLTAAFVFLAFCVTAGVPTGLWIRSQSYLNATPHDLAVGGVHVNPDGASGTVMLLGDSLASMYGTALRDACIAEDRRLVVLSVAGANPLISEPDEKNVLWERTLEGVKKARPDIVFIGCQWSPRIRKQPGFPSLVLDAIRPHTNGIVLIDAVPLRPDEGTRAAIRAGARPPFVENEKDFSQRIDANQALAAYGDSSTRILEASKHFSRPDREVVVLDQQGRYLYHDRGHVSGWGAALLEDDFRLAIQRVPQRAR